MQLLICYQNIDELSSELRLISTDCLTDFKRELEHVYMRPEVNSNQFEISLQGKISLPCEVTSLSALTSGVVKLTPVQISLRSN